MLKTSQPYLDSRWTQTNPHKLKHFWHWSASIHSKSQNYYNSHCSSIIYSTPLLTSWTRWVSPPTTFYFPMKSTMRFSLQNLWAQYQRLIYISSFYFRAMWLHNDIILAKLQDGSITVLIEHFLHLLRSTGCHIILAESSSSWKTVQTHLCNPTHVSNPPSVSLNSILRDIEIAGYHLSSHTHFTITETDDNHFHLIPETSSSYPTESGTPDIIPTPDPIAFSG